MRSSSEGLPGDGADLAALCAAELLHYAALQAKLRWSLGLEVYLNSETMYNNGLLGYV